MIRHATLEDEQEIRSCAEDAYTQYVTRIGRKPAPMVADFAAQISRNCVHVIGKPREIIQGFIVFFQRDDHIFLENIAVRTSASGQGLGKALLRHCEEETRRLGLGSIELYTNEKMFENLALYPRLGYQEIGRREEDGFKRVYFRKKMNESKASDP